MRQHYLSCNGILFLVITTHTVGRFWRNLVLKKAFCPKKVIDWIVEGKGSFQGYLDVVHYAKVFFDETFKRSFSYIYKGKLKPKLDVSFEQGGPGYLNEMTFNLDLDKSFYVVDIESFLASASDDEKRWCLKAMHLIQHYLCPFGLPGSQSAYAKERTEDDLKAIETVMDAGILFKGDTLLYLSEEHDSLSGDSSLQRECLDAIAEEQAGREWRQKKINSKEAGYYHNGLGKFLKKAKKSVASSWLKAVYEVVCDTQMINKENGSYESDYKKLCRSKIEPVYCVINRDRSKYSLASLVVSKLDEGTEKNTFKSTIKGVEDMENLQRMIHKLGIGFGLLLSLEVSNL